MFNNPGKKIKTLAKVMFWLILIACVISAVAIGASPYYVDEEVILAIAGIVVGGFLVAYLSGLWISAFGELVENSTKLARHAEESKNQTGVNY